MKMRISAWSIQNPIPVVVLFLAIMVAGLLAYRAMPIKLYPDVSFPIVQVAVALPSAAATEVETQVTRVVEDGVANVARVKHVISTVTQGMSVTFVEFEIGLDPQRAVDEVRAAIDRVRANLPASIEPPIVERLDFDAMPLLTYAVSAQGMDDVELNWFIEDVVARRLVALGGVGQVTQVGGVGRDITVTLDPARLQALGLTAVAVNDALRSHNLDASGGRAQIGAQEQQVRVLAAAPSVESLAELVIATRDGRHLRLSDVATVASGASDRRGFAVLNGEAVVGFQVMKTKAASDVNVESAVAQAVAKLAKEYPGVTFQLVSSGAKNTRESFDATVYTLLEGMLLAAVVVFMFLRDWRATVIAAVAMPISLIPTFAVIHALGYSLNMLSLLALTLVIGVLVDDAIVEVENIQKRVQAGASPWRASMEGADAIGLAVVATTLAIAVVFLPVAFMGGYAGPYFREFGVTVAVSVLFSLLVARLLSPLMCAYLLKPSAQPEAHKPFAGRYRRLLEWTLAHRWISLGAGVLIFVGSLLLASLLPTGFAPKGDSGTVQISMQGAPGSTTQDMRVAAATLTRLLREQGDVRDVFVSVGSSQRDGDPRKGAVIVQLKSQRSMTTKAFQDHVRPLLLRVPDVRLSYSESEGGGTQTLQVILGGHDGALLRRTASDAERELRSLPMLENVHQVAPNPGPELVIRLKPDEAARLGVTPDVVAEVARMASVGDLDATASKFNTGRQRLSVRVRLPQGALQDVGSIGALRVPTTGGGTVPLSAVADMHFQVGESHIDRFDRERRITLEAEVNGASFGQANAAVEALPFLKNLPAGVSRPLYGDAEGMQELFASFGLAIMAGIGLIFGVLILLFRSFIKPVIILAALPLSLAGAFLALLATGGELNLPVLIGLLMLMGLAAKNSILLVEHAVEAERMGKSQTEALLEAAHERTRPIVMTTIAMAMGMLPTALGVSSGSEFRQPLAVAVIGGLVSSTALSLILVPVVYAVMDDLENWLKPRLVRLVTVPSAQDQRDLLQTGDPLSPQ
ncbi:efflux RND transporter permease subunit [Comamonas odontotermitis]|uniref:efflux RND transporter permease subunit n=1 Tax=Comamonas odontotermitis TaxID=379895 RepID=UPI001CC5662D|nr:efflux RND transporter permease subunit [Comamonas odontotermitis]UBB15726.1 efflux RND transporter permease subunit [Comamonas odontotermitis]